MSPFREPSLRMECVKRGHSTFRFRRRGRDEQRVIAASATFAYSRGAKSRMSPFQRGTGTFTAAPRLDDSTIAFTVSSVWRPSSAPVIGVRSSSMHRKKCSWIDSPFFSTTLIAPPASFLPTWPAGLTSIALSASMICSGPSPIFLRTCPSRPTMIAPFVPTRPTEPLGCVRRPTDVHRARPAAGEEHQGLAVLVGLHTVSYAVGPAEHALDRPADPQQPVDVMAAEVQRHAAAFFLLAVP